jgi:murein DD-endopeptidase MepM/ murein hydrolase activator NlpD
VKINWKLKNITIMIIPEANRSVKRLRIPRFLFYVTATFIVTLVVVSVYLSAQHSKFVHLAGQLTSDLSSTKQQLAQTSANKDLTIDQLQSKVIDLSQQADQMKSKVEELQKLEQEIKGTASANKTDASNKSLAAATSTERGSQAMGGELTAVSSEEIIALSDQTTELFNSLSDQIDATTNGLNQAKQDAAEKKRKLDLTPSIYPSDSHMVTSTFGYRIDPFTYLPSFHTGIDFGANIGDPVYSTASGSITFTGSDASHGKNIIVTHSAGLQTRYMHLSKISVSEGDTVKKGQFIGEVGSTGRSTGPHMHYEVLKYGTPINPRPYLPK